MHHGCCINRLFLHEAATRCSTRLSTHFVPNFRWFTTRLIDISITPVIETFAICRLYRFHWPWFSLYNYFLLHYVDASLWKFLYRRAAFRLQVGQLLVQEVECRSYPKKKYWQLLRRLLFIVVQLRRTLLLHHGCTMLPMYSSQ